MKVFVEFEDNKKLYTMLKKFDEIKIIGFYTNDIVYGCTDFLDYPFKSLYKAVELYKSNIVTNLTINDTLRIEALKKS